MQHVLVLAVIALVAVSSAVAGHTTPLQPTVSELQRVVRTITNDARFPEHAVFVAASPANPKKHSLLDNLPPQVHVTLRDPIARRVYEVMAELPSGKIREWQRVDDVEPVLTKADMDSAEMVTWRHDGFRRSLERRGIDSSEVYLDIWPSQIPRTGFRFRNCRVIAFQKGWKGARDFTRPIEGLVVTVNLDARRAFEFYDKDAGPVLDAVDDQWKAWTERKRERMAVLSATGMTGDDVSIRMGTVTWSGWTVHPVLTAREGLVLYDAAWDAPEGPRPVVHRIALSELVEINASSSQYWYWRHPLLIGELGLGDHVMEQFRRIDMPRYVRTIDVARVQPHGSVQRIPDAIACYVDQQGLAIKSTFRIGHREIAQIYHLTHNGGVTAHVEIGGIEAIEAVGDSAQHHVTGALLSAHRFAPFREYTACFRIDVDLGTGQNTVSEVDILHRHDDENPYHQLVEADDYQFYREVEAQRDADPMRQRFWRVSSRDPERHIELSYRVEPDASAPSILSGSHVLNEKAAFMKHTLWVTQHHDQEMFASGPYPNQTVGGSGLPVFVRDNEGLRAEDVVLWTTVRRTHRPRKGAGCVMEPLRLGVRLLPDGFVVPRSR